MRSWSTGLNARKSTCSVLAQFSSRKERGVLARHLANSVFPKPDPPSSTKNLRRCKVLSANCGRNCWSTSWSHNRGALLSARRMRTASARCAMSYCRLNARTILDVSPRIATRMKIFLDRSGVGHFLLAPIRRYPLGLESNCAVNAMATRSPDSGKFRGLAIIMTSSHCCFVTTTSSSLPSIPVLADVRPRLEEEQFSCRTVERERLRSF